MAATKREPQETLAQYLERILTDKVPEAKLRRVLDDARRADETAVQLMTISDLRTGCGCERVQQILHENTELRGLAGLAVRIHLKHCPICRAIDQGEEGDEKLPWLSVEEQKRLARVIRTAWREEGRSTRINDAPRVGAAEVVCADMGLAEISRRRTCSECGAELELGRRLPRRRRRPECTNFGLISSAELTMWISELFPDDDDEWNWGDEDDEELSDSNL